MNKKTQVRCISYRPACDLAHDQLVRWENMDGSRWKFVERVRVRTEEGTEKCGSCTVRDVRSNGLTLET